MNASSVAEFLAMGGYGLYVWGAFGVTALVLAGEMLSLRSRRRALCDDACDPAPRVISGVVSPVDFSQAPHEA